MTASAPGENGRHAAVLHAAPLPADGRALTEPGVVTSGIRPSIFLLLLGLAAVGGQAWYGRCVLTDPSLETAGSGGALPDAGRRAVVVVRRSTRPTAVQRPA